MKIIASTPHGYILDASKEELANLTGYYSSLSRKSAEGREPCVGDSVEVSRIYTQLYTIVRLNSGLRRAAANLREAAKLIESVEPPLAEIPPLDKERLP